MKDLSELADKAKFMVEKLSSSSPTQAVDKSLPLGTSRIPANELYFGESLVFTSVKKGGLAVAFGKGTGFIITKLERREDGSFRWSAPLMLKLKNLGAGLVAGFTHIDSLTVLDTKAANAALCKDSEKIKSLAGVVDMTFRDKFAMNNLGALANFDHVNLSKDSWTYSMSDGVFVDAGFQGASYTVDSEANQMLYGTDHQPVKILSGEVPAPDAIRPLYEAIDKVTTAYCKKKFTDVIATTTDPTGIV